MNSNQFDLIKKTCVEMKNYMEDGRYLVKYSDGISQEFNIDTVDIYYKHIVINDGENSICIYKEDDFIEHNNFLSRITVYQLSKLKNYGYRNDTPIIRAYKDKFIIVDEAENEIYSTNDYSDAQDYLKNIMA